MVEDYVNEIGKKEKKTYAPVSFGSHSFNATQLNPLQIFASFILRSGLLFTLHLGLKQTSNYTH